MCRNIKALYNFDPPASKQEIDASALQYLRKITGLSSISAKNQSAIDTAVKEITLVVDTLFSQLQTTAALKNRDHEAAKAKARSQKRFGS